MGTQSQMFQASTRRSKAAADHGQQRVSKETEGARVNRPKKLRDNDKTDNTTSDDGALSDQNRRQESSKLSQQALAAQQKAQELRQAANGVADPDERQHLMEEAINKQIEAESFGKTARYLQSGAFQGMTVGTGIGTVPGLTLGTLTGTLVGGTVSIITGGLGGAVGAATGAIHGPFWDLGKIAGRGIRKVTGDLPGWKATGEQKAALEKMIGQVNEQEVPSEADLSNMAKWDNQTQSDEKSQTWMETGASYLPSMSAENKPSKKASSARSREKENTTPASSEQVHKPKQSSLQSGQRSNVQDLSRDPEYKRGQTSSRIANNHTRQDGDKAVNQDAATSQPAPGSRSRKAPRKLRRQQPDSSAKSEQVSSTGKRKTPRKLEVRTRVSND